MDIVDIVVSASWLGRSKHRARSDSSRLPSQHAAFINQLPYTQNNHPCCDKRRSGQAHSPSWEERSCPRKKRRTRTLVQPRTQKQRSNKKMQTGRCDALRTALRIMTIGFDTRPATRYICRVSLGALCLRARMRMCLRHGASHLY